MITGAGSGSAALSPSFGVGSPLEPGRYVARLMLDDGYSVVAETTFTVR